MQRIYKSKMSAGRHKRIDGIEYLDKVIDMDQSPIGRTPRSNPATYTGVFDSIRKLFASTNEAKVRGYMPGRFSFNVKGGRCEACAGDGTIKIEMHFLPDVYVPCEVCKGARYNRDTLDIEFKGHNIADVLDMPVAEAVDFFANQPAIARYMQTLMDVGLGYVRLGQPAPTLSGGEAQRVKLATELAKRSTGHTIYLLDEPTTGLHFDDVRRLLTVLSRLVDQGNTVLVIEHNLDVIKTADWIIDLGPEGGSGGGTVIAEGSPEHIATVEGSHTGRFLRSCSAEHRTAGTVVGRRRSLKRRARRRSLPTTSGVLQRRTLNALRWAQVPGQAAVAASVAVGHVAGEDMLGTDRLAGLASARVHDGRGDHLGPVVGPHAPARPPAGTRRGAPRRIAGVGVAGTGGQLRWFPLFVVGMAVFGAGQAATLQSRYVGADLATPDQRAKSIAAIVWVGTLGAVFGPIITPFEKDFARMVGLDELVGPYVFGAALFLVSAAVMFTRLRPDPLVVLGATDPHAERPRPLRQVQASYGVIGGRRVRSSDWRRWPVRKQRWCGDGDDPAHMKDHGHADLSAFVIAVHILGMFGLAPSSGGSSTASAPCAIRAERSCWRRHGRHGRCRVRAGDDLRRPVPARPRMELGLIAGRRCSPGRCPPIRGSSPRAQVT